jgi:hypothetical protein
LLVGVAWSLRRRLGRTIMLVDPLAARRHEAVERALRATAEAVDRAELVALTTRALAEYHRRRSPDVPHAHPGGRRPCGGDSARRDLARARRALGRGEAAYLLPRRPLGLPPGLEAGACPRCRVT